MNTAERRDIVQKVADLVPVKHVDPANLRRDYAPWRAALLERQSELERSDEEMEAGVRAALGELRTSHVDFVRPEAPGAPPIFSLNALLGTAERAGGQVCIVEQVIPNGPAARAGIVPSDILLSVNGKPVSPPKIPSFPLGQPQQLELEKWATREQRQVVVELPRAAKEKDRPPMVVPELVTSDLLNGGVGYIRGAYFQGVVGLNFIARFEAAVAALQERGAKKFVLDFRGNPGGGLASLRVMSWLLPKRRVPVGYSLTRHAINEGWTKDRLPCIDKLPTSKWQQAIMAIRFKLWNRDRSVAMATEELPSSNLAGRSVLLFDRNSRSAAEMVAAFASEHRVAPIVGSRTPGEVLGAVNFKLPHGYVLRMPIATWSTWSGATVEGVGIAPTTAATLDPEGLSLGVDTQVEAARQRALEL